VNSDEISFLDMCIIYVIINMGVVKERLGVRWDQYCITSMFSSA